MGKAQTVTEAMVWGSEAGLGATPASPLTALLPPLQFVGFHCPVASSHLPQQHHIPFTYGLGPVEGKVSKG